MILYNVTIKIDLSVHEEWLRWMQTNHIPKVMKTGLFFDNKIFKLLNQDETDGITYSIQYFCKSLDNYHEYFKRYAEKLQKEHTERYQDKFVSFRTLLDEINIK